MEEWSNLERKLVNPERDKFVQYITERVAELSCPVHQKSGSCLIDEKQISPVNPCCSLFEKQIMKEVNYLIRTYSFGKE